MPEPPAADSVAQLSGAPASTATVIRPRGLFASSASTAAMGLYVPATAAVRLINFARLILLTWWMTTQQFGLLTIILLIINVLTPVCSLGLTEAVARYVPQFESRGRLRDFVRRALRMVAGVAAVSTVVLLAVAPVAGPRFFDQLVYGRHELGQLTRLAAVVIGLLILYFFMLAVLKGLRMIRALAFAELLHSIVFLALAYMACRSGHASAKTMTACYGASLALTLAVCGAGLWAALRSLPGQSAPVDDPELHHRLLAFSSWAMIAGVTWQVLQYYPAWYLNKVMGNDAVAVFSAVRQVGQFVLLGAITLVTVVMSAVTRTWETRGAEAADRQLSLAFRGAGVVMLLGCAVIALARNLIVRLFSGSYAVGADILPLQLLFFLVGGNFAFIALHFNLIEKPRLHFLPYAIGVAAGVVLGFWLFGERFQWLRASAPWQLLAPLCGRLLVAGVSDPLGLGAASWCGVLAILAALAACLILLRSEGRRLDRGSYIVLGAALLLAANNVILIFGVLALVTLIASTEVVFTARERRELLVYAAAALRSVFRPSPRPDEP
jgi:O-antigen/teichoic acid export membrane protein